MINHTDELKSRISNPYVVRMLDYLGDRNPIEVISRTPDALSLIVSEHSVENLRKQPFENKWTPLEIIGHFADVEWILGFRLRHIYCENQPPILGVDQDQWVARLHHNHADPNHVVDMFRSLRQFNLHLWKQISIEDLQRTGIHSERGEENLDIILHAYAGHDLYHLEQIEKYLEAIYQNQ